jgi:hypothetical protein
MTWIVVAITKYDNQMERIYYGPFDSETKANQYAEIVQKHTVSVCSFSVRLEKPVIEQ